MEAGLSPAPYTPRCWSRTTLPCSSSTTRLRIWSTMRSSWVAMTTVVPVRLIRSSSRMMSPEVVGSRFPVGSSHSISSGRLTNARAIETRCCSPPDSSCGNRSGLSCRPTSLSTSGTVRSIECRRAPMTSRAKATFSRTVLLDSSLKSWNTQPMERRRAGTFQEASRFSSLPATQMRPPVGRSSLVSRRRKVDFPEPDWPTTKTNSPLPISTDTSSRAITSFPYDLLTWSSLITGRVWPFARRGCTGEELGASPVAVGLDNARPYQTCLWKSGTLAPSGPPPAKHRRGQQGGHTGHRERLAGQLDGGVAVAEAHLGLGRDDHHQPGREQPRALRPLDRPVGEPGDLDDVGLADPVGPEADHVAGAAGGGGQLARPVQPLPGQGGERRVLRLGERGGGRRVVLGREHQRGLQPVGVGVPGEPVGPPVGVVDQHRPEPRDLDQVAGPDLVDGEAAALLDHRQAGGP